MGVLTSLTLLDLNGNLLTRNLPTEVGNLKQLQVWGLSHFFVHILSMNPFGEFSWAARTLTAERLEWRILLATWFDLAGS